MGNYAASITVHLISFKHLFNMLLQNQGGGNFKLMLDTIVRLNHNQTLWTEAMYI